MLKEDWLMVRRSAPWIMLAILAIGCGDSPTNESGDPIAIVLHTSGPTVREYRTIEIEARIDDGDTTGVRFDWTASAGSLTTDGATAMLHAPAGPESVHVSIQALVGEETVDVDTVSIFVYRQWIILKADDLTYDSISAISEPWADFFDYVLAEEIPVSVGLIGNSLSLGDRNYFDRLRGLDETGLVELWNHGYDHIYLDTNEQGESYSEFSNTPFDFQLSQAARTQSESRDSLGITLTSFGAPGNSYDNTTYRVLEAIPEIRVWFFGSPSYSGLVLLRFVDAEYPVHHPDAQQFIENYMADPDYLVLQLHPGSWNGEALDEFKAIVAEVLRVGGTFITARGYAETVTEY